MDPSATNPGPVDPSILYDQEKHVSSAVWDGQVRFIIIDIHKHAGICVMYNIYWYMHMYNFYSKILRFKNATYIYIYM